MRKIVLCLLLFFSIVEAFSTRVSILTTTACDDEVYTLWGHTAVRVCTDTTDVVYNYGVFEFDDGFIYKFVKGETDYWLEQEPERYSVVSALYKNVYLYEQVLDLSEEEAMKIRLALEENVKEENKYYRYNFFFDNCATRPRDLIEKELGGLVYPRFGNTSTFRDEIYKLTAPMPWLTFGIDLCLGLPTDRVVSDREMMFLPYAFMKTYAGTMRNMEGMEKPLVKETNTLASPLNKAMRERIGLEEKMPRNEDALHPTLVFAVIAIVALVLTLYQYRRNRKKNYISASEVVADDILFVCYGLTGLLVAFVAFISVHPCTHPNFNLLWVNPLQLFFPVLFHVKRLRKAFGCAMWLNLFGCVMAVLGYFLLPQRLNDAVLPLSFLMIGRSLYWLNRLKILNALDEEEKPMVAKSIKKMWGENKKLC